mmetsp:Transcript_30112/g.73303  ORF Transcript_30112/g.73303 Transcript_30112/m.73303 type:complete len:485 (+) Transcript_30112:254-1708(+)
MEVWEEYDSRTGVVKTSRGSGTQYSYRALGEPRDGAFANQGNDGGGQDTPLLGKRIRLIHDCDSEDSMPTSCLYAMCWAWLLAGMMQTLPASFFPLEANAAGASDLAVGFIFASYQMSMILSTPVMVAVSPRVHPIALVRLSLLLMILANGLFALTQLLETPTTFVAVCVFLRALCGVASCGIMIGGNTCIIRASGTSLLGYNLAMFETAGSVGLCLGPIFGSYIYQACGYIWAFVGLSMLMASGLCVITATLSHARVDEQQVHDGDRKEDCGDGNEYCGVSTESWGFIQKPYVALLCIDLMFAGIAWTFLEPVLEKHVQQTNNLGPLATGGLFATMSIAYIFATSGVGLLTRRLHGSSFWNFGIMYLGMGILFIALIGLSFKTVVIEIVSLMLLGIGQALTYLPIVLALTLIMRGKSSRDVSALVAGLSQFSVSVGFALGPFVGSILTSEFDFSLCCIAIAVGILSSSGLTAVAFLCDTNLVM